MQATEGRCEGVTLRSRLNNADYQKCIFCQKDKKHSRNRWLNESLVRCDDDGSDPVITPKWMTQPAAPKALLELVSCGCSSGCDHVRLSVADAGSPTCAAMQHAAVPTVQTQTWQIRMKAMSLLRPPAKKVHNSKQTRDSLNLKCERDGRPSAGRVSF